MSFYFLPSQNLITKKQQYNNSSNVLLSQETLKIFKTNLNLLTD